MKSMIAACLLSSAASAAPYDIFARTMMSGEENHNKEIFAVRVTGDHYEIPKADSATACSYFGARVCTQGEMTSAQQNDGAQWCACSWVSDNSVSLYPMQSGGTNGCGGPIAGVRSCAGHGALADVCCVHEDNVYETDSTACADCEAAPDASQRMVIKWSHRHPNMQIGFKCDWTDSSTKTACSCTCHQPGDRLQGCYIANNQVVGGDRASCIARAQCSPKSYQVRLNDAQNAQSVGTGYTESTCQEECQAKAVENDGTVACMFREGECVWSSNTEYTKQVGAWQDANGAAYGERDFDHADGPSLVEPTARHSGTTGAYKSWIGVACYPNDRTAYSGSPGSNAVPYLFDAAPTTTVTPTCPTGAANIVTDGSFNDMSATIGTGWSEFNHNTRRNGAHKHTFSGTSITTAHLHGNCPSTDGGIQQTITTTPGVTYTLSLKAYSGSWDGSDEDELQITAGSNTWTAYPNANQEFQDGANAALLLSYTFTPDSSSTVITFFAPLGHCIDINDVVVRCG